MTVYLAAASYSALSHHPRHLLVSNRSIPGACLFAIASASYFASAILVFNELVGIAIALGMIGLFVTGFAYVSTQAE